MAADARLVVREELPIHPSNRLSLEDKRHVIHIAVDDHALDGDYASRDQAEGLVLFAHGTGNSRRCPRNQRVTKRLGGDGFSTLLIDLLTPDEKVVDAETQRLRFDVERLGERIVRAVDWLNAQPENQPLNLGCIGSSMGAAAALIAAEARPETVRAVVALEGRVDMAASILDRIRIPVLSIVAEHDYEVLALNRRALARIGAETRLEIVAGRRYLFDESNTSKAIGDLVQAWFLRHLAVD